MFIEIEDLRPEPLHVQHTFDAEEIRFEHEDAVLSGPVTADFMLTHDDRDLRAGGIIETAVRFKCARCIREFSRPLSMSFDLSYMPQPAWKDRDEVELRYDEMEIAYYDGIRFDVDQMVSEQIELALPMRFICREDCKGLCFKCGADLNEGACPCRDDPEDSRLSVLLEFRKKLEKE